MTLHRQHAGAVFSRPRRRTRRMPQARGMGEGGRSFPRRNDGEGYAALAAEYDGDNPLFGPDELTVRPLLDAIPLGRVLDAACGTGRHARHLRSLGHEVIGVDGSVQMLIQAPGHRSLGELIALPLRAASVDAAVCTLALTYLPSLEPAYAELARVVRPGGTIITSDIHVLSLYLGGVSHAQGRRMPATRFFASDYIRAINAAGLEIVSCHEPRWGVVEGEGGPLAQEWCPAASAAAYRDTPAAIVWELRR